MSPKPPPRWIIVDDIDPRIQYNGPGWFQLHDNVDNFDYWYESTIHDTEASGSLSFAFTGLRVNVIGPNYGASNVTWECFIDGISIGSDQASHGDPYRFCFTGEDLVDGPHVLTVNVTMGTSVQLFFLNTIQYVPSSNISPLDGENIRVENTDPAMHFGDGWSRLSDIANFTNTPNASMGFSFTGTSMTWYGTLPQEAGFPLLPALGSYSVDGGESIQFPMNFSVSLRGSVTFIATYFGTQTYPVGLHEIVVTFLGSRATTPLILSHVVVQNGTISSTSGSPVMGTASIDGASMASGTTRSTAATPIHHSGKNGMIVGGVVGGALVVLLTIALLYLRRQREKQKEGHEGTRSEIMIIERFRNGPTMPLQNAANSKSTPNTRAGVLVHNGTTPTPGATKLIHDAPSSSEPSYEDLSNANPQSHRRQLAIPTPAQPPNSTYHAQPGTDIPPRVIHHEDSGVRLPGVVREPEVVEIPPVYTVV